MAQYTITATYGNPLTYGGAGYASTSYGGYSGSYSYTITVADVGILPFIRENDIDFSAKNLKPAARANLFFDSIKVNNLSQKASIVNVSSSSALSRIHVNEGIFGATSHAYAEVLGTSRTDNSNLLYVNDNYLSLFLEKVSGADPAFTSTDFNKDDIVYQTSGNTTFTWSTLPGSTAQFGGVVDTPNYTFYGKVKYWNSISTSSGVLVVEPFEGRVNTALEQANSEFIFNAQSNLTGRKVSYLRANARFQASESLLFAANSVAYTTVGASNAYVGFSSAIPKVNNSANLYKFVISSNNYTRDGLSTITGNTLYVVSGTNQGFSSKIISVDTANTHYTELRLENAMPRLCTSNSIYSIGEHYVDDAGSLYGILHIPSETNLKWPTGDRVFTVTDTATYDDNNYGMRSIATYSALGVTNTVENARNFVLTEQTPSSMTAPTAVTQVSQKINDRKYMSQTFFTPRTASISNGQANSSYGIFISSIDLYFKAKPSTASGSELLPFSVGITKTQNGIPTEEILAERTLDCAEIVVANTPSLSNTATRTRFSFNDPVYVLPETEYAIRLHTESSDYEVWTATVGGNVVDELGNTRRVSDQPYVGSFFKAQNASNWNPIQNQDLMFSVNRASFNSTAQFYLSLDPSDLKIPVLADLVKLSTADQQFTTTNIKYELSSKLIDGTSAGYVELKNGEIYNFAKDLNISTANAKRRRLIRSNQPTDMNIRVTLSSTDETVSPVVNNERLGLFAIQNIINNAGIANNLISIKSPGSGYTAGGTTITIGVPDVGVNQATANVLPGHIGANGEILGINIINPGSGYFSTPSITISGTGTNAVAKINGETDAAGGNHLAKYQTKIVALSDGFEAGDLIVRMDAIRPDGTDIQVYFKVLSGQDSDAFVDKKWVRMSKSSGNTYSTTMTDVIQTEYKYNLDNGYINYIENGKNYPLGGTFKYFAVKIRLSAADPSVVPSVDSLRVMAVPGG